MDSPRYAVSLSLFFFFAYTYTPVENFAVNCGNSGDVPSNDQRNWKGDDASTLFSLIDPVKATESTKPQVGSNLPTPYDTARLSRSEFSYSFPVSDGQKFIRLYFYPSSYNPNFLRFDAFFSVKAGPHTLLKDFIDVGVSPNIAAPERDIIREYCVNVDRGGRLNITFTPNPSDPNAYAFVNGIEVVSMPCNTPNFEV